MDQKAIFKLCKELGCCDACGLRYLGLKNPRVYENLSQFCLKYHDNPSVPELSNNKDSVTSVEGKAPNATSNDDVSNGTEPPTKRQKKEICVSCLGILQDENWPDSLEMVKEIFEKKQYECETFACALSSPIAAILRERAVALALAERLDAFDPNTVTPLKEAWKWSFGLRLAAHIGKNLDSGAISSLLITLNMEYPDEAQELEILKSLSPGLFESRSRQKRRFAVEFTRRSVEQALEGATLGGLRQHWGCESVPRAAGVAAKCVSVVCARDPLYLGGRYIKLSRSLPQTPWLLNGVRVMDSSVQELIFEPIAKICGISPEDIERRLKLVGAGREDVDVRCLGAGRPFAIEISDPRRELTRLELQQVCEDISSSGKVVVKELVKIYKDDLALLKTGEETKCKTYEALCVKLSHSESDLQNGVDGPIRVTPEDISRINSYRNTGAGDAAKVTLEQKTPIRVLHRRPLLNRVRRIYDIEAASVKGEAALFTVRISTQAGTYVKEWAHGDLGRTRPALRDALCARADILALDVTCVHLDWPPNTRS